MNNHTTSGAQNNPPAMILLFGMPRSGTTWVGKIFDSHPNTLYRHEPDSWGLLNAIPVVSESTTAGQNKAKIQEFCAKLADMKQTKVAGSTPIFPKAYHSTVQQALFRLNLLAAKGAAKFLGEQPIHHMISNQKLPGVRIVWKSIESLGRMGLIQSAIAPSHGVQIIRHPCGYVSSVIRGESQQRFTSDSASSEDWGLFELLVQTDVARGLDLSIEKLKAMDPVERLAYRWVVYNETAIQHDIDPEQRLVLKYEDLCVDPSGMAKQLFEFAHLDWNEQTSRFVDFSTSKDVGRYYSVVKDPLKASNKWKDELPKESIDKILAVVDGTQAGRLYM